MVKDLKDPRRHEPGLVSASGRCLMRGLSFTRTTLLLKCEGLDDAGRKSHPAPTSRLYLHGLVRHMAEVERNWFRRVLLGDSDAPFIWHEPGVEDSELVSLNDADRDADLAAWQDECHARARRRSVDCQARTREKYRCPAERWYVPSLVGKKGILRESMVRQAARAGREVCRHARVPAAAHNPGRQGGFWISRRH